MCGTSFFTSKKTLEGNGCVLCVCLYTFSFKDHMCSHTVAYMILSLMLKGFLRKLERIALKKNELCNLCEIKGCRDTDKDLNYNG